MRSIIVFQAMLTASPPLGRGHKVCDLLAGTGRVTRKFLPIYPRSGYTLVDLSQDRLDIAGAYIEDLCQVGPGKLVNIGEQIELLKAAVNIKAGAILPGCGAGSKKGYDVIFAALCARVLVQPAPHYRAAGEGETETAAVPGRYLEFFRMCLNSLRPGGHVILGDHVGIFGLFDHLKVSQFESTNPDQIPLTLDCDCFQALEEAGFEDVDCSWREQDFFVCAGRKPEA